MVKTPTKREIEARNVRDQLLALNNINVTMDGRIGEHKEKSVNVGTQVLDEASVSSPTSLASPTSEASQTSPTSLASPASQKQEKQAPKQAISSSSPVSTPTKVRSVKTAQKEEVVVKKKHTFELNETSFASFSLLSKVAGKTLNDYIDELIARELDENKELIAQLLRLKK